MVSINCIFRTKWKQRMIERMILIILFDHPLGLMEDELQFYVSEFAKLMGIDDIL